MRGAITGKDVILHSVMIVRLWGFRTWLRCLWTALARRPSTFLGVLYPDGRRSRWARPSPSFALARAFERRPPDAA
jgi:hypothetical protein